MKFIRIIAIIAFAAAVIPTIALQARAPMWLRFVAAILFLVLFVASGYEIFRSRRERKLKNRESLQR